MSPTTMRITTTLHRRRRDARLSLAQYRCLNRCDPLAYRRGQAERRWSRRLWKGRGNLTPTRLISMGMERRATERVLGAHSEVTGTLQLNRRRISRLLEVTPIMYDTAVAL